MSKVALVTGASRGIGRATALRLAREGYDVCVNYLTSSELAEQVCDEIRGMGRDALCLQADVGSMPELRQMFEQIFERFGKVDLLVNNAGITEYLPFLECTEQLWERLTNTDWKGSFFATQLAAKKMVELGIPGVIINITSIHQECCFPISNVYGPTKAALHKFSQHAALELAPYGIRVVAVSPGCTQIRAGEDETPRGKQLSGRIPLGRYAGCEEIAETIVWLASEKASYITGTCISVDGGALLPTHLDNRYVEGIHNGNGKSYE